MRRYSFFMDSFKILSDKMQHFPIFPEILVQSKPRLIKAQNIFLNPPLQRYWSFSKNKFLLLFLSKLSENHNWQKLQVDLLLLTKRLRILRKNWKEQLRRGIGICITNKTKNSCRLLPVEFCGGKSSYGP